MIKKIASGLVALGAGFIVLGADNALVGVGTWKMNIAKSSALQFRGKQGLIKKSAFKDDTLVVTVEGETMTVRGDSTMSGQPVSFMFTVPTAGGPLNYTKGAPPDGIADTWDKVDDRTEDIISTQNGKQVLKTHVVVSANQKLMTITTSGVDDKGKAFRTVSIYDRQ